MEGVPLSQPLTDSYRYCTSLARRTGRNFYFTFLTLPRTLFRDMCVLYAFMRITDDLGDSFHISVEDRRNHLAHWRGQLHRALAGEMTEGKVFPALADVVARHRIPSEYLDEVINGVQTDLTPRTFRTFDDLSGYCYQVAGAVGLCCIHIWGFHDDRARQAAIDCGTAFQLTNILRDLAEDVSVGRVYLPEEDLRRFDYGPDDLRAGLRDERFREMMQFQVDRAHGYYERAVELYDCLSQPGRRVYSAMYHLYGGLLQEIERRNYDVYSGRVRLSTSRKWCIAASSLLSRRFEGLPRPT